MNYEFCFRTDPGLARENNEDSVAVDEPMVGLDPKAAVLVATVRAMRDQNAVIGRRSDAVAGVVKRFGAVTAALDAEGPADDGVLRPHRVRLDRQRAVGDAGEPRRLRGRRGKLCARWRGRATAKRFV